MSILRWCPLSTRKIPLDIGLLERFSTFVLNRTSENFRAELARALRISRDDSTQRGQTQQRNLHKCNNSARALSVLKRLESASRRDRSEYSAHFRHEKIVAF